MKPVATHLVAALGVLAAGTLAAQQPAVVIGGDDARGAELGTIEHVLVLPTRLVVVDGSPPFVKVFDHGGRLVQAFGRTGGGPGEYRHVDAVVFEPQRRELWLVDNQLARVSRFASGDTLRMLAAHRTELTGIVALCAMNGRTYALSPRGGRFVHELAVDGELIVTRRAWGEPKTARDLAANPALRNNSANGPIACDAAREVVYAGATLFGEVHRVDLRAGTHTVAPIPAFAGMEFRPSGGGVTMAMPERGWIERIVDVRAAGAGVEVTLAASPTGPGRPAFATVVMPDGATPAPRVPSTWRAHGSAGALVVCSTDDPAPTLALFRGERCP